jgi:hypothetical protein
MDDALTTKSFPQQAVQPITENDQQSPKQGRDNDTPCAASRFADPAQTASGRPPKNGITQERHQQRWIIAAGIANLRTIRTATELEFKTLWA